MSSVVVFLVAVQNTKQHDRLSVAHTAIWKYNSNNFKLQLLISFGPTVSVLRVHLRISAGSDLLIIIHCKAVTMP